MNDPNVADPPPSSFLSGLGVVRVLCVVALGLSAYLLWGSLTGQKLPGCGLESGCGAVTGSRWGYLFRVPVSLPALVLYAAILASTFWLDRVSRPLLRRVLHGFLIASATMLLGAAVWFVGLQLFVIGSICPFCMTAHGCGLGIGLLLLWNTRRNGPDSLGATKKSGPMGGFVLAGLAAVALLIAGQMVDRPQTFAVSSSAHLAERKAPRKIQLHGETFQLDLSDVPVLGSPEAPCVIVHLFDYSCPHCRALHPLMMEAYRNLSNRVAIAALPVPMATNCNRLLKKQIPAHINACAYAYAALAVWRVNPAKMQAFEDWIFAPTPAPAPEAVQAKAMELVGTNQFNQALADPWIKQQLEFNISLYEANYRRYRKDVLPQLMIGTNLVFGSVGSAADLYKLVTAQVDVQSSFSSTDGR